MILFECNFLYEYIIFYMIYSIFYMNIWFFIWIQDAVKFSINIKLKV